mgnify:CR=1 FL=1
MQLQYNSPVILTFFLLSLGALFLGQWTGGWTTKHLFCVYRGSLKDPLFYIRLFGHVLGHANWEHFLNNMLLLLVVGPPMEEKYGSIPLLKGILFTALLTGVLLNFVFGVFATRVMIRGAASIKALRNPWLYGAVKPGKEVKEKKPIDLVGLRKRFLTADRQLFA